MRNTARALLPLAVFFLFSACRSVQSDKPAPEPSVPAAALLSASPNAIVGRVLSVDFLRAFAIIDIAPSTAASAIAPGRELLTRTDDLRVTAQLHATRQLYSRTLGAVITAGTPNVGDEVIFPTSP